MIELLSYRFFIHALTAAVFTSITCGIIGTYIVTRRIVFISGGISHASFGGVGAGYFLGINPILGAAVFSVLSALGIQKFSQHTELREDSLIGIMWSFGMALGIIFVFLTPGYAANLMSYLFGDILTVSLSDILLLSILAFVLVLVFVFLYKEILLVSFDESYARSQGIPVQGLNYLLISLVALTIVFNIRVVGIILVISLLTIPQATANILTRNHRHMIWLSIFFAMLSSISGLFLSYLFNIPSGATIIFTAILVFILVKIVKLFRSSPKKSSSNPG